MSETQALTVQNRVHGGLIPQDMDGLWRMAQMIHKGGFAPPSLKTPEAVAVAIQMGLEVGLSPMQAVSNIAVINARPSLWGDAALGLVQASGLLADIHEWEEGTQFTDAWTVYCRAVRVGKNEPITRRFSWKDAGRAGLTAKAGPWKEYPHRMMQMRARSWCLRDGFADVLKGLSVREEAQDIVDLSPDGSGSFSAPSLPESQGPIPAQSEESRVNYEAEFWNRVRMQGIDHPAMVNYIAFLLRKTKHTAETLPVEALKRWDDFEKAFRVWESKQAKTTTQAQDQTEPEKSKETASSQASGDGVVCPNDGRDRTAEECAACTDRTGCPEHETGEEKQP